MTTFHVSHDGPERAACDLVAVPVYAQGKGGPGADAAARALGVPLRRLLEGERMRGEVGDVVVIPSLGRLAASRVALVGVGAAGKTGPFEIRRAAAALARRVGNASKVAATIFQASKGPQEDAVGAFVEGFELATYRFDRYKKKKDVKDVSEVVLLLARPKRADHAPIRRSAITAAIRRAQAVTSATNLARDLANTPSLEKSPQTLAAEARRLARSSGLSVRVLDHRQLAERGFGGLLGVGRGSSKPPRLIEVRYMRRGAKRTIALVGKGITFDSGGLNIKTSNMDWMKTDMTGGGVVLALMSILGSLKPAVNVIGIVCAAENMPGGNALHPGDVLRIYGGKTVEVGNTDAEGRLVMADGIEYAKEKGADVIVDIATLTGASIIALGPRAFGVFGNDAGVVDGILAAAGRAGEPAWQMPLYPDYRKMLDSEVADIRNIGGPYGGAITAALFLKEFVDETPWAHLDIAGPSRSESEEFEIPKGATGSGLRTLAEWLCSL